MNNFTIKLRLYLLAGLIVLSLVMLAIMGTTSFSKTKQLNETLLLVESGKAEMLMLRRNEKDFLARLDLKYQAKFQSNLGGLITELNILKAQLADEGIDSKQELAQLIKLLGNYGSSFNALVKLRQEVGLTHEQGLRRSLRKSVHDAEKNIKQHNLVQIYADMLMLRRNEKDFLLRKQSKYIDKFNRNSLVLSKHLDDVVISSQVKNLISQKLKVYKLNFISLTDGYKKIGLTSKTGLHGDLRQTVRQTETIFDALYKNVSEEVVSQETAIYTQFIVVISVLLIILIGLLFSITHSINARLKYLQSHLAEVALDSGDLSVALEINGNDEITKISELFNQFVANLRTTFVQIPSLSDSLDQASDMNVSVADETNQLALAQQGEAEQMALAIGEMVSATEEIAQNISGAAGSAEDAKNITLQGKQAIQSVSSSVNVLAEKLHASINVTKELEDNSNNISVVLDVIRGIAEQTNLLALNAAIEAARAGENGRGFAVVADEVRTLAQRTQESTEQIQSLIENLQTNVKNTVAIMQDGESGASSTVEDTDKAMRSLDEIVISVNKIYELNVSIASASEEQAAVSNTINQSISSINQMAELTAKQSAVVNSSSQGIKLIASDLQSLISTYKF